VTVRRYVRFWDFEALDNADISGEGRTFELDPIREIKIGSGVRHDARAQDSGTGPNPDSGPTVQIKSMIRSLAGDHWLIQDGMGALWKMDAKTYECAPTMFFHSGAITGVDVSTLSPAHTLSPPLSPSLRSFYPLPYAFFLRFWYEGVVENRRKNA
jgi:hypothetical protein